MRWCDYQVIGAALDRAHPNANYLVMADDALADLVMRLPGFLEAGRAPADGDLRAIRFAWIAVAEGEDEGPPIADD